MTRFTDPAFVLTRAWRLLTQMASLATQPFEDEIHNLAGLTSIAFQDLSLRRDQPDSFEHPLGLPAGGNSIGHELKRAFAC